MYSGTNRATSGKRKDKTTRSRKKNDRIAGDEASNTIGELQGVARTGPDDLHLLHIETSLAPLGRQMINARHFEIDQNSHRKKTQKTDPKSNLEEQFQL